VSAGWPARRRRRCSCGSCDSFSGRGTGAESLSWVSDSSACDTDAIDGLLDRAILEWEKLCEGVSSTSSLVGDIGHAPG
jgi:hypothetical protein